MIRETIRATVRGVGVVLLTAVEVTALSVWLGLVSDAAPISTDAAVGVVALAAGMLVEALLVHVTVNGWGRPVPTRAVAGLAVGGAALWVGWLGAVQWLGGGLAGVVSAGLGLAVALVVRHTVADNAVRGRRPLATVVQRATIGLAVLEAAGASAWLLVVTGVVYLPAWMVADSVAPVVGFSPSAIVGGAILACAVFAKHLLAVRHALRPTQRPTESGWGSSRGTRPE